MQNSIVVYKDHTRRISLEPQWFDYHIDSLVYSFMLASATVRMSPEAKKDGSQSYLYLSESKYKKIRPTIKKLIGKEAREVNTRVKKLIEQGFIYYSEQTKQYTFPFNYNEKYYIVSVDVLAYLCTVSNPFAIKIYFYLADRYNYKKNYRFTLTELRKILGYTGSANANANNLIKMALSALSIMNFISYQKVTSKTYGSTERPVQQYQLTNVVGKTLPKIVATQLQDKLSLESKNIIQLLTG